MHIKKSAPYISVRKLRCRRRRRGESETDRQKEEAGEAVRRQEIKNGSLDLRR